MSDRDSTIEALEDEEQTVDPAEVYDDINRLPDWWRKLVNEFKDRNLRPYQPSQLTDGTIVYEEVEKIEQQYNVDIELKATDPTYNGEWTFFVNGSAVVTVPHERKPQGYTEYGITRQELEDIIRTNLEGVNGLQLE